MVGDGYTTTSGDKEAWISSLQDYYPFGLAMEGRSSDLADYRYGLNGKEKDPVLEWGLTNYDYGYRLYNSNSGQFLSLDPLMKKYPALFPYVFVNNNPILYKDIDGRDWIYYDESENELKRTKSKWYHFHWLKGDKKIILTNKELEKGGFFAYVNFHGTFNWHASLVDLKTGDLFEARHPLNEEGEPIDGSKVKRPGLLPYQGISRISKFKGDKNYEFANKEWWTYKVKNKDGSYTDKSPDEVGVTYIWIPNRQATLDYLEGRVEEEIIWSPTNNCKTFCRDAIMEGFTEVNDKNHLEIKNILSDEDTHPGIWYNEFEENKSVKNPEKKDEK